MESGVATRPIRDFEVYQQRLHEMIETRFKRDHLMEESTFSQELPLAIRR